MFSDMQLFRAIVFIASVIALLALMRWRRVHPFIAIMAVAVAFGYIALSRISIIVRIFGAGFSDMIYMPGLVIIAAGLIAGLAETTGASDRLMAMLSGGRRLRPHWIAAVLGLVAGLGASPSGSFALLSPLLRPIGGKSQAHRQHATVALGLALSASHGLLAFSPVAIAAISIIGADWSRTALVGVPLAILLAGFAALFAGCLPAVDAPPQTAVEQPVENGPPVTAQKAGTWSVIVLVLATMVPLLLLMVASLGDIPSEPLGGEPRLDWIIAIGRPLTLFVAGIGVMVIGMPRASLRLLGDSEWAGRILANVASTLVIVCAAGGFQALCQQTGMSDGLGARVLNWHVAAFLGVLVAFLATAVMKTLQGSSLLAVIASAGMVQPLLTQLGLADANGKVLAALAVGMGAMTVSHVNDDYFWLVTTRAGFSPLRGIATISLGTLLQGLIAVAMLLVAYVVMSHI
jgi:gluconate:H+ symporter, GntP family